MLLLLVIAIIIIIICGFAILAYLNKKWIDEALAKQKLSDELTAWLKSTHHRLDEQSKNFLQTLSSNTKTLNERLDKAAQVISRVQKSIGEMSEIGRGMRELQEFLNSPKIRGNIGEQVLKELLMQMLPKQQFYLQYSFSSGVTVDAAIKTSNGIIPVDAKFPMENFRKMAKAESQKEKEKSKKDFINDVRKHIRDIAQKYIVTEEGTMDRALMYLPSEAVYYEVVNEPELFDYSVRYGVMPVSPTTFYAFLKTILMSFEGQKVEQQAKLILAELRALQKDYGIVEGNLQTLRRHLNNAYNMATTVFNGYLQLGQRIKNMRVFREETAKIEENH